MEKIWVINPLEQFKIYAIPNVQIPVVTNMVVILISASIIYNIMIWLSKQIGTRWNIIKMSIITTIIGVYKSLIKEETKLVPYTLTIFSIIVITNITGLIPYGFTAATHISLTLSISLTIIIGVTIMGNKSIKFYSLFIPSGTPIYLVPLIVGIELISYISRIFSLALRLTANISAGHCLINVISMLSYKALSKSIIIVVPIILLMALYSLELLVAVMQAYVFTLLTCSYINDIKALDGQ